MNSGTISGSRRGIDKAGTINSITNQATGLIHGDNTGLYVGSSGSLTITNAGRIDGWVYGVRGYYSFPLLTNQSGGVISGTVGAGMSLEDSVGVVVNEAGGRIESAGGAGVSVGGYGTSYVTGTVSNAGVITGSSAGVLVQNGRLSKLANTGTVSYAGTGTGPAVKVIVPVALPAIPGFRDLVSVAQGGMGIVCRAIDESLERRVAVKLLLGWRAASASALQRARREALVLARIDHPGVVRLFSAGDVDGLPWIAMEWIEGPTLARRLSAGPLAPREAARIARELARAVARVHAEGIVHRDIKPDNVLLAHGATAADAPVPKLIDFGLARPDVDDVAITQAAGAIGTPSFMAPEQTDLDPALGPVGPATDIHALGATLYCMLTGRAPYQAATTNAALARAAAADAPALALLAPGIPADLRTIVEACLRRRPEARYRSAADVADDLTRFLDGAPVAARPVGRLERLVKWARRHPGRAAVAAAGLLVACGAAVGATSHVRRLEAAHAGALASAALARQSFQRLTDDTAERLLVRGGTLDDLDRDHLRAVRDEYRTWPLEPEVATALRFRIAGLRRVAMIFGRLERDDEMVATIEMTLAAIDELERRGLLGLDDEILRHELYRGIRSHLARQGRGDDALAALAADIARLEQRVETEPALRPVLAATLGERAVLLDSRGLSDEAASLFRRALALFDAVAREGQAIRFPAHLEMSTRFNAAISTVIGGPSHASEEVAGRLVERAREVLPTAGPEDLVDAARGLVLGLRVLAKAARDRGAMDVALAHTRQIAAEARALLVRNPGNHVFTDELVLAAIDTVACHEALGHPDQAIPDLEEAIAAAEAAATAEPASFLRVKRLAAGLVALAGCAAAGGDRERALACDERAVAAVTPWLHAPGVGGEARELAVTALEHAARQHAALKRPDEARAALEQAKGLAPAERQGALDAEIARVQGGPAEDRAEERDDRPAL